SAGVAGDRCRSACHDLGDADDADRILRLVRPVPDRLRAVVGCLRPQAPAVWRTNAFHSRSDRLRVFADHRLADRVSLPARDRCGNPHQNGLTCGCDFDSALLESPLHAAVEFALHRPATAVGAANLADDRRHRAVHLVDAPQFEIAADCMAVFGLATHFSDDILEYLAGAVGVFLVGNVDADGRITGTTA